MTEQELYEALLKQGTEAQDRTQRMMAEAIAKFLADTAADLRPVLFFTRAEVVDLLLDLARTVERTGTVGQQKR
jgi:hypothetical protein